MLLKSYSVRKTQLLLLSVILCNVRACEFEMDQFKIDDIVIATAEIIFFLTVTGSIDMKYFIKQWQPYLTGVYKMRARMTRKQEISNPNPTQLFPLFMSFRFPCFGVVLLDSRIAE